MDLIEFRNNIEKVIKLGKWNKLNDLEEQNKKLERNLEKAYNEAQTQKEIFEKEREEIKKELEKLKIENEDL